MDIHIPPQIQHLTEAELGRTIDLARKLQAERDLQPKRGWPDEMRERLRIYDHVKAGGCMPEPEKSRLMLLDHLESLPEKSLVEIMALMWFGDISMGEQESFLSFKAHADKIIVAAGKDRAFSYFEGIEKKPPLEERLVRGLARLAQNSDDSEKDYLAGSGTPIHALVPYLARYELKQVIHLIDEDNDEKTRDFVTGMSSAARSDLLALVWFGEEEHRADDITDLRKYAARISEVTGDEPCIQYLLDSHHVGFQAARALEAGVRRLDFGRSYRVLTDGLELLAEARDELINPDALLECLDGIASSSTDLKDINQYLLDHPLIEKAIPYINRQTSNSGKKTTPGRTLAATMGSKVNFFLNRPCAKCGSHKVKEQLFWSELKQYIADPGEVLEHNKGSEQILKHAVHLRGWRVNPHRGRFAEIIFNPQRQQPILDFVDVVEKINPRLWVVSKPSVCKSCNHEIVGSIFSFCREAEERRIRRQSEAQAREEEKARRAQEKREEHERKYPRYITVKGDVDDTEAFDAQVNRHLNRGYYVWGQLLITSNGVLVQPLLRKDMVQERASDMNNRSGSRGSRSSKNRAAIFA